MSCRNCRSGVVNINIRQAMSVLDAERLDLLIQRYVESGHGNRSNRDFMTASQLRSNLDSAEWVLREIKESVVKVVWGTNDPGDVVRLIHLIKRVNQYFNINMFFTYVPNSHHDDQIIEGDTSISL